MDSSKAKDHIKNWQNCDIAQLVNHFHFKKKNKAGDVQQLRLESVVFEKEELEPLKSGELSSMILYMALDKEVSQNGEASFSPILEICKTTGKPQYALSKPYNSDSPYSGLVPHAYKEAVARNWLLCDSSAVDDLFLAFKEEKKNTPAQLERLLRYYINKDTNALLFQILCMEEVRQKLKGILVYLGADMNKLNDKSAFTFTPVIELKTQKLSETTLLAIAQIGLRSSVGVAADDDDGILFEYLKPCPATCN